MKQTIAILLFLISFSAYAQTLQQIDNQYAFAKTYGYLKYFYPRDEAAKIDWDKFAFYGAQKVENCKNATELKNTLTELVGELMPDVKILNQTENYKFDAAALTPNNLKDYNTISWQHLGVGLVGDKRAPYQSARTNRITIFKPQKFRGLGSAVTTLHEQELADKNFVLTYRAKMIDGDGKAGVYIRVDQGKNKHGLLKTTIDQAIDKTWRKFTIKGKIDKEFKSLLFGAILYDKGKFAVDDLSLIVEGKEIYLKNFEDEIVNNQPLKMTLSTGRSSIENAKYIFTVKDEKNNKYLLIESPLNTEMPDSANLNLFDKHNSFGEYAEKEIGSNLKIIVRADMKMINDSLSLLKSSKAIIFDLRGKPNENSGMLEYLMTKKDTASKWLQAPEIIYPDQEKIVGYRSEGWDLEAKTLNLTAKIFFLIDGRVISAGESYASLVEHYKLGILVGQPTAGTNGEVNTLTLPGGFVVRFTGLKAVKHDGSQLHGIGIVPNISVTQTAKGIKEGRDEILERAIAEALK